VALAVVDNWRVKRPISCCGQDAKLRNLFHMGGLRGTPEHLCLPTSDLVPCVPRVHPIEAVCVVVNYLTAHMALPTGTANVQSELSSSRPEQRV